MNGITWTRDGRELLFGGTRLDVHHLWRVAADGSSPPTRIEIGRQGMSPAIAPQGDRLAFLLNILDHDIYAFEAGQPERVVASSTLVDFGPHHGPDGRFAFESSRFGEGNEIWVAEADGSNAIRLTHGPGRWQGAPAWSPDGSLIAFTSLDAEGGWHVWAIQPDGLGLKRMTVGEVGESMPAWSRDGRWLYFTAGRPDGWDYWRMPISGGAPERITHDGAFRGVETPDGQTFVFTVTDDESPLFALPLAGGPRRRLAECVISRSLAAGPDGIYYMGCPAQVPTSRLYRLDLQTGTESLLGTVTIGGGFVPGMSVSPDGKRVLYTRRIAEGSDLMLVEHFH